MLNNSLILQHKSDFAGAETGTSLLNWWYRMPGGVWVW